MGARTYCSVISRVVPRSRVTVPVRNPSAVVRCGRTDDLLGDIPPRGLTVSDQGGRYLGDLKTVLKRTWPVEMGPRLLTGHARAITIKFDILPVNRYLGGAFDVESLVETLLKQLAGDPEIVVNVYDVTTTSMPLIMYGPQDMTGYMLISHVSMLDFGDPFRKHQMECRYSQKPPIPWSAIYTPSGVFVIVMLIGYIIFTAYNRYVTVVEDCRKMEELKVKAEAADVAKSQFLATVSHEIRTPMNGVLGMLDMLLDTDLCSMQKDYVQTAQVCGKALISLINEVLDRAKIEAGKLEMEAVPFDLRSILDDVISLFSTKSSIELAVFVSDKVPDVLMGDPRRFRQIITNLVGNSVKFTERGHIFIQVHLANYATTMMNAKSDIGSNEQSQQGKSIGYSFDTLSGLEAADGRNSWETFKHLLSDEAPLSEDDENVTLMVSVEDTGIGIPLHAQDRVFTPFMQADSSTSRNYGGTGIGLSINKCLVELMGGQITFVSRPLIGSTFTFTAVLKRCGSRGAGIKRVLSESLPTCFRGKKAIVLDERPVRGAVTRYHLQRLGITVEIPSNLKMALSSLSEKNGYSRPSQLWKEADMIFVEKDLWNSGVEAWLTQQLLDWKQNGQLIDMPKIVLLVSLESDKSLATRFVDLLILKPLRASIIAACLLRVLGIDRQQERKMLNGSASLGGMLAGKNILVVDDNKVNLIVAARALKKYGASVECAESGKDALTLLQIPHKFDACFMDVQMPEMDGFEATRRIRLMESLANELMKTEKKTTEEGTLKRDDWHMPILAMTADVIQATYEECMKCGMDGYVSKPFEEKQLFQAVARFFDFEPM
ncbi:hypothetical protein Taro_049706 [Colocasia esculenta]|uniref:histidine kinase n=1 Tax=Colocasia esculenta TaxID=4460 RepID=A0A843XBP6_COLES|nr:hypothetical protein [Colocasia esculenta]